MGIINVTPDSFSDGGCFTTPSDALACAANMIAQGADIIDIGGESSRPEAAVVDEAEELRRVIPVIEQLAARVKIPISIDTQKPAVARAALAAGASIVNDIAANRVDESMWCLVAETGAGYICMHMQGTPQTMQQNPKYEDVVDEVNVFFTDRLQRLQSVGVQREQVLLDVGIGFGKTVEQNLKLVANLRCFNKHGRPLVLGVSRKSFLGAISGGAAVNERLPAALACSTLALVQGANVFRTHDVAATRQALRVAEALTLAKGT